MKILNLDYLSKKEIIYVSKLAHKYKNGLCILIHDSFFLLKIKKGTKRKTNISLNKFKN